jgi:hypothetical protein
MMKIRPSWRQKPRASSSCHGEKRRPSPSHGILFSFSLSFGEYYIVSSPFSSLSVFFSGCFQPCWFFQFFFLLLGFRRALCYLELFCVVLFSVRTFFLRRSGQKWLRARCVPFSFVADLAFEFLTKNGPVLYTILTPRPLGGGGGAQIKLNLTAFLFFFFARAIWLSPPAKLYTKSEVRMLLAFTFFFPF